MPLSLCSSSTPGKGASLTLAFSTVPRRARPRPLDLLLSISQPLLLSSPPSRSSSTSGQFACARSLPRTRPMAPTTTTRARADSTTGGSSHGLGISNLGPAASASSSSFVSQQQQLSRKESVFGQGQAHNDGRKSIVAIQQLGQQQQQHRRSTVARPVLGGGGRRISAALGQLREDGHGEDGDGAAVDESRLDAEEVLRALGVGEARRVEARLRSVPSALPKLPAGFALARGALAYLCEPKADFWPSSLLDDPARSPLASSMSSGQWLASDTATCSRRPKRSARSLTPRPDCRPAWAECASSSGA